MKAKEFRIGTSKRQSLENGNINFPEAGTYNPNDTLVKASLPTFGFGMSGRDD
jgi:hypothetical protein